MKGLLIKDWFVIWKHGKFIFLLALIYGVMAIMGNGYFFAGFSVVFLSMLPLTVMGLDERSKWEHYAVTMPYSRKEIVLSKYIITVLGAIAASLLFLISTVISWIIEKKPSDLADLTKQTVLLLSLGLIYSAINLPVAFKFGVDKGRLWFILITVVIVAGFGSVISLSDIDQIESFIKELPSLILLIAIFLLLAVSAVISVRIYENKEL